MVACKDWHDIPAGPVSWIRITAVEKGRFPHPSLSYLFTSCFHCAHPLCAKACPVNAITKRKKDGVVVIDRELCIGAEQCRFACRKACPYDVPQFESEPNPKAQKCDLCLERAEQSKRPICVEACPMRALDVGPLNELKTKYGDIHEAEGFDYSKRAIPSVVFK